MTKQRVIRAPPPCHNAPVHVSAKYLLLTKPFGGKSCCDRCTPSNRLLFSKETYRSWHLATRTSVASQREQQAFCHEVPASARITLKHHHFGTLRQIRSHPRNARNARHTRVLCFGKMWRASNVITVSISRSVMFM